MIYIINPIIFPLTFLAWQFPPHMKWEPPSTTSHTSHAGSHMQWIHATMLGLVLRDSVGIYIPLRESGGTQGTLIL